MTHTEQRIWLIEQLLSESNEYKGMQIPSGEQDQKDLLRALMNVRAPKGISDEFLVVQDEYLKAENEAAGITDVDTLQPLKTDSRLYLWQGDMTTLKVDAIVNPANSGMCGCFQPLHNCADNIIHTKSGIQLRIRCNHIMQKQGHEEPTGQAKITPAYNLPCEYVLHTVGPIVYDKVTDRERDLLASSYYSCLKLAAESGVKSIALCCISTGVFRFPNELAAQIAVNTVREFLAEDDRLEKVVFNVYKDLDLEIYRNLLGGDRDEEN